MAETYRVRYKNKTFSNEKVEVDGKSFAHCEFDHCIIVVETGDTDLSGCRFKHCQLLLRGNAYKIAKIITFFSGKSPLKVLDFEEPLFEKEVSDTDKKQSKGGK